VEKTNTEAILDIGDKRPTRYGNTNLISAFIRELLISFNLLQIRLNARIVKTDVRYTDLSESKPETNKRMMGFEKRNATRKVINPAKREKLKTA
jgi:hypothetical protein